ncbi:Uncharacterised protein [BD1-7 clade bacterium]|uniref:Colicin V production protein n=1 Tax=BD1-7 clade bacterium TaxID=2029982 RepID=A0A5S9N0V8_9GAMM|nr:Uncharacterised protein [BD1-7 clade bacterium]CAA0082453.1 Uncharacterised protein [BD1-7 clade bacterium]
MEDILIPSLAVFVGIFAVRGLMKGFVHLLVRIISLGCAYGTTFLWRGDFYRWVAPKLPPDLPQIAVQMLLAMAMFFGVMFVVGQLLHLLLRLCGKAWPTIEEWRTNTSYAGRISGMLFNSALGLFVALVLIWGYGVVAPSKNLPPLAGPDHRLIRLADTVASGAFMWGMEQMLAVDGKSSREPSEQQSSVPPLDAVSGLSGSRAANSTTGNPDSPAPGTAYIQSADEPDKILYVDERERLAQSLPRIHSLDDEALNQILATQVSELPSVNIIQSVPLPDSSSRTSAGPEGEVNMQDYLNKEAMGLLDDPNKMREALSKLLPPDQAGRMSELMSRYLQDPDNRRKAEQKMKELIGDPQKLQEALNSDSARRLLGR